MAAASNPAPGTETNFEDQFGLDFDVFQNGFSEEIEVESSPIHDSGNPVSNEPLGDFEDLLGELTNSDDSDDSEAKCKEEHKKCEKEQPARLQYQHNEERNKCESERYARLRCQRDELYEFMLTSELLPDDDKNGKTKPTEKHTLELACQLIGIYQEKIASFGQMSQVPLSFSRYKQFYDAIRPSLVEVIQGGAHSPCEVTNHQLLNCAAVIWGSLSVEERRQKWPALSSSEKSQYARKIFV